MIKLYDSLYLTEFETENTKTDVLLSEIVELIYNDNSKTTQKLKAFAMKREGVADLGK
jgi:hypothetical protein